MREKKTALTVVRAGCSARVISTRGTDRKEACSLQRKRHILGIVQVWPKAGSSWAGAAFTVSVSLVRSSYDLPFAWADRGLRA